MFSKLGKIKNNAVKPLLKIVNKEGEKFKT